MIDQRRRRFLQLLAYAGAGIPFLGCGVDKGRRASAPQSYPITILRERTAECHAGLRGPARSRAKLPTIDYGSFDVVIVGGGLSGITAALELPGRKRLLLEKESQLGGQAISGERDGYLYSRGAAYVAEPSGDLAMFYEKWDAPLVAISEPADSLLNGSEVYAELLDVPDMKRFRDDIFAIDPFPDIPLTENFHETARYDDMPMADFVAGYDSDVRLFADLYCRSALGAPSRSVSAYCALNFLWSEFRPKYSFAGGVGALSQHFAQRLEGDPECRVENDATVFSVQVESPTRVVVHFIIGDQVGVATARRIVLGVPKYILPHVLEESQLAQRDLYTQFEYAPYVVLNLFCKGVPLSSAFDVWMSPSSAPDVIDASWMLEEPPGDRQVLTVYCPIEASSRGRLEDDSEVEALVQRAVDDVAEFVPALPAVLEEAEAYVRGHALPIPYPGFFGKVVRHLRSSWGPVALANTDLYGAPAVETAMWSGLEAAGYVRG